MIRTITLSLLLYCLIFTSCTTDVEINDPALQAKIGNDLFRSSVKKATLYDDGTLVISGSDGEQTISFTTNSLNTGTYKTSKQSKKSISKINYQKQEKTYISKDGESDGQVIITDIIDGEISGNFYFDNLKDENGNAINFRSGWFYRLPVENGTIEEEEVQEINPCLLNASLTAMADGSEMITDDHSANLFGVDNVSILITAANETQEITIVFPSDAKPGEYALSGSGDYSATYAYEKDKSSAFTGRLIITEHNIETKCISGTFEFETRSDSTISEGRFDFGY